MDSENIKDELLKFESYLHMFDSIQKQLDGTEVDGVKYGALLILNNILINIEAIHESYQNESYIATHLLNRQFNDIFLDLRLIVEDLTSEKILDKESIVRNLRKYSGYILWREKEYYLWVNKQSKDGNYEEVDKTTINQISHSTAIMKRYYENLISELSLEDITEKIKQFRHRPTFRNLIIPEGKSDPRYDELYYPWGKVEYIDAHLKVHGTYNSLWVSGDKCIPEKENINSNSILIHSQLAKLDRMELYIKNIFRSIWPDIAFRRKE